MAKDLKLILAALEQEKNRESERREIKRLYRHLENILEDPRLMGHILILEVKECLSDIKEKFPDYDTHCEFDRKNCKNR